MTRRLTRYLLLFTITLALPIHATEANCSPQAIHRPLINDFFSRGDYEGAIARLEQAKQQQDACRPETLDADWYWLRSDLSLAYLKAGREQDCLVLLGRLINNPASFQDIRQNLENEYRLHRALETNQQLCGAAHEKRLSAYRSPPCPQPVRGALASVATAADRCLVLLPVTEAESCPKLEEWQHGKPLRQLSPSKDDITSSLADTSRCCSIQTLRVSKDNGQYRIRLQGEGRDCYGGTAYDLIDTLYLLKGNELVPEQDFSGTR